MKKGLLIVICCLISLNLLRVDIFAKETDPDVDKIPENEFLSLIVNTEVFQDFRDYIISGPVITYSEDEYISRYVAAYQIHSDNGKKTLFFIADKYGVFVDICSVLLNEEAIIITDLINDYTNRYNVDRGAVTWCEEQVCQEYAPFGYTSAPGCTSVLGYICNNQYTIKYKLIAWAICKAGIWIICHIYTGQGWCIDYTTEVYDCAL